MHPVRLFAGALLALALVAPAAAQLAESGSFRLSQATFGGGGTPATSGSFILGHTTGQDSVVGEAGSASFLLQSGFWTSASVNRVLTLAAAGSGEGALSGEFFACDAAAGAVIGDCEEVAVHGSSLAVTAAPQPGSFFTGWSGCDLLSTNSLPEDTCLVVLSRDVTATAEFVAAGGLAGRVWLDHDGNGLEDAGEPGVPGVDVSLSGGAVVATITDANGEYAFDGLFPQSYTVAIDPADLPAGTQPTFDVDGTATPHEAAVIAPTAQQLADVDFGVQPLADLELTMFAEHLNEETVRFTVTVTNLGPSDASGVVATTDLQPANSDVSSTGCAEDPAGIPNCSLGSIAAGESADFIFDVTARGGNSVELVATVTADAVESDPVAANNGASRGSVVVFPIPVLGLPGLVVLLVLVLAMAWWPPVRRAAGSR